MFEHLRRHQASALEIRSSSIAETRGEIAASAGVPSGSSGSPITLTNYGSGVLPKITGSTALVNSRFTLSPGRAFTYQEALTVNPGHYSAENGNPLLFASSIAGVEAVPGSFWWSASVYYVHPSDNSNPSSNGRVYETSTGYDAWTPSHT